MQIHHILSSELERGIEMQDVDGLHFALGKESSDIICLPNAANIS